MSHLRRTVIAAVLVGGSLASMAGCSSDGDGGSAASAEGGGTYTFWDPYPQDNPEWLARVSACGKQAGVSIKRTGMDTTNLGNKALLAGQQGDLPDVMVVDNPLVSTLVEAGILNKNGDLGLDTSDIQQNIIGAGVVDGASYGIPIGANTLALYYNKKVLSAAGVDPAGIKDWASLTGALRKVKAAGGKGITFAAVGTEEGSFQFLPWFWGAGGELTDLDSPNGVAALTLWKDWVSQGLAPHSVLQNNQTTSWQEFATGEFAFGENGTWQISNAGKLDFDNGVITIPAEHAGAAPVPTGGEFVTVPVQKDTSRYKASTKIVRCLTSGANLLATDNALPDIAPIASLQARQVKSNPALKPWVAAVAAARGRTADGLGTRYPVISQQMWTAVQSALSGGQSAQAALSAAQSAVGAHKG